MNSEMAKLLAEQIFKEVMENPAEAVSMIKELYKQYKGPELIKGATDLIMMVATDFENAAIETNVFENRAASRMRVFKAYVSVGFTDEQAMQLIANDASNYAKMATGFTNGVNNAARKER